MADGEFHNVRSAWDYVDRENSFCESQTHDHPILSVVKMENIEHSISQCLTENAPGWCKAHSYKMCAELPWSAVPAFVRMNLSQPLPADPLTMYGGNYGIEKPRRQPGRQPGRQQQAERRYQQPRFRIDGSTEAA
ncbi:hypothetical protein MASSI9I_90577 [Massilia sp. 9I]|nr:hypothetical protein MASSI9I_90577 [Massilia sp. 9I]